MAKITTLDQLRQFVGEAQEESLVLEYKASAALDRGDRQRDELCRDISAFANSAGGRIIYGIGEDSDHRPTGIDAGTDNDVVDREWIENVLSGVRPAMRGVVITPIASDTDPARFYYVIDVPQAISPAPHQAPDNRYYKRQNFRRIPMEDYEIRDAMGRSGHAELYLDLKFKNGATIIALIHQPPEGYYQPVQLFSHIYNRTQYPASYTIVEIGFDTHVKITSMGDLDEAGTRREGEYEFHYVSTTFSIPQHFPIFKERPMPLGRAGSLAISPPFKGISADEWLIRARTITPGYVGFQNWVLRREQLRLRLFAVDISE
jgi:hypothetical protein